VALQARVRSNGIRRQQELLRPERGPGQLPGKTPECQTNERIDKLSPGPLIRRQMATDWLFEP